MKKKIILSVALAGTLAFFVASNLAAAADLNKALSTLPQNEEWSIMAYASSGQNVGQSFLRNPINNSSPTDYEKRILAITAQGENPAAFSSENFVAKLESFFDGTQIGDPSLVNDDIFGLAALYTAGERGDIISKLRSFILGRQNSDGGWGFSTTSGSDSNTTALAVSALKISGGFPDNAINYLNSSQDSSGGYGFTPGQAADGASTAWVIWGLNAAGRNVPDSAKSFLENLQLPSGGFKWLPSDTGASNIVTAYAVVALNGKSVPLRVSNDSPNPQPTPSPTPDPAPSPDPEPAPNPTPVPPSAPAVANNAACMNISVPASAEAGKDVFALVTFKNTGNTTWTKGNYFLGSQPQDNVVWGLNRVELPNSVAPDDSVTFAFNAKAPANGGNYTFNWSMVEEHVQWFGNICNSNISVSGAVNPPPPPAGGPQPDPAPVPPPAPNSAGNYRVTIIYPDNKIYVGDVSNLNYSDFVSKTGQNFSSSGPTALQALVAAMDEINLLYDIPQTGFGPFVQTINGYRPTGASGWLYAVNGQIPQTASSNYLLQPGDRIQWFYGDAGTQPY